jgi:hypothetical protein
MRTAFRSFVVLAAGLCGAGTLSAQTPAPSGGTTPGTGMVPLPMAPASPAPLGLATVQPAENLYELNGQWTVVAPYAWVYGMRGMVGAGNRTVPVNVSVSDAFDKLDDLKGAAELHVESGYGNVGVIADLMYMRLASQGALTTVDSRSTFFELLGMYRLIDTGGRQAGAFTFDLLGGLRYYRFKNEVEGNLFGALSAERTNDWTDLVVGARAAAQLTNDLGVFARADIGGFGIGDSSSRACNVIVGFEYKCCECASLVGGYRWLKIDRENGVGRDRFLLDATLSGPFAAFAFRF